MQNIKICPFCDKPITDYEIKNTFKIGYSKGRQVKQYFHNKCLNDYIKKEAKK